MTRIGASQVFFNIVAQFNAEKLIKDYRSINTVMKAVSLDTFEAILKPVEGLSQGINQITDELMPLQEQLGLAAVEFEKFFGSAQDMEAMRDSVMDLGQAYAQTGVEALAAGSRASQVANLIGRGNVKTLVELSLTLSEISDLNAEEAQRGIIQLHQQTGMLFGELNRESFNRLTLQEQQNVLVTEGAKALDALNTIANRSVALEGDLVRVMGTFAAQGELVGDSFEFMAAASATLLEAGEEQGTAGRALRMMYARLGGDISGARTQIEAMGFELTDSEGNMKTMQDVLTELSSKGWNELAGAEKQAIAQTIAGNRHYVRFIKLMENYERTMQLAADGAAGYDSALVQANKALGAQVNLLRKAQAENENLKSTIGEGLNPFMRGQVEVQNDYLRVTESLTDGLGDLGIVLGRLKGTMQVMGGFIKIGLATQSLGIGFEMFTSVQRQLNDILVANEHLHSKQANYLDHGVRATATQRDLLNGIQYIQQRINMHAQERRAHEKQAVPLLERQKDLQQRMLTLEEARAITTEKYFQLERGVIAAERVRTANFIEQDNIYEKRLARLAYEKIMGDELLEQSKQLYNSKSATEDAYRRQVQADFQVILSLSEEELENIRERHDLLREEHTLLQTLKADNELRFRSQGGNRGGMTTIPLVGEDTVLQMSQREREILAARIDNFGEEARLMFERKYAGALGGKELLGGEEGAREMQVAINKMKADQQDTTQAFKLMTDATNAETLALKVLTQTTQDYTGGEANVMFRLLEDTQGQLIQTTRALETYGMATADAINFGKQVRNIDDALRQTKAQLRGENKELLDLSKLDLATQKELEPLLKIILDHKTKEVDLNKALTEVTSQLHTKRELLTDQAARFIQKQKDEIKFTEDNRMAKRQLGFAMNNLMGLTTGLAGGTLGASLSMSFMASNIISAGKAATVSATQMIALQYSQMQAAYGAQYQTTAVSTLGKAIHKVGLEAIATARALGSAALAAAPFLALGAGIYAIQKNAEDASAKMKVLNDSMLGVKNAVDLLSPSAKVLPDDALAKTLGIDNIATSDLVNNMGEIDKNIGILTGAQGKFNETQNLQIEGAINYLNILKATIDETTRFVDKIEFDKQAKAARDDLVGIFSAKNLIFAGGRSKESMQELGSLIGEEMMFGMDSSLDPMEAVRTNLDTVIQHMGEGNRLTEEQLELFDAAFDDKELSNYIRAMNDLIQTEETREYNLNAIAGSTKEVNQATANSVAEIKNLTEEIYNFSGAREELFFGGKYGNVTGSLYKQVVTQGVGTLYHKNEVIMTTNFHGFFNEKEAADRITAIVTEVLAQ